MRRRLHAEANAWRMAEGEMLDRKSSRKLKGYVLYSCIMPAYACGLQTVVLSEQHHTSGMREQLW